MRRLIAGQRISERPNLCDGLEEYIDHGIFLSKDRRPALDEMMAKARRRAFDAIAIVKLDRLPRSTRHLTQLAAELEAWGVDLIVLDQAVDTSTPSGKLFALGAIGEFELDLIRERTRADMRAAQKRGKRIGRPEPMWIASSSRERSGARPSPRSL